MAAALHRSHLEVVAPHLIVGLRVVGVDSQSITKEFLDATNVARMAVAGSFHRPQRLLNFVDGTPSPAARISSKKRGQGRRLLCG